MGGARLQFLSAALSVVVPTLDEAEALPATLAAARQPGVCEVIVVDGGSRDGTLAVAGPLADRVLRAPRGRAQQMNAGAAAARADVLLFLHADTRLPAGYAQAVAGALADPAVVGGRFDVRLDAAGLAYRALGRLISLRSRLTRVATGDQAIFVRRAVFERLGGYPLVPLMEDVALSRAMKRAGRVSRVSTRRSPPRRAAGSATAWRAPCSSCGRCARRTTPACRPHGWRASIPTPVRKPTRGLGSETETSVWRWWIVRRPCRGRRSRRGKR